MLPQIASIRGSWNAIYVIGLCSYKETDYWRNLANKGKGRTIKGSQDHAKSSWKGKEEAHVTTKQSDDDEGSEKAFIANVVNENAYDFSAYLWIVNSATTSHICVQWDTFTDYQLLPQTIIKEIYDKTVTAEGYGTVVPISHISGPMLWIWLSETLYVPEVQDNLLSLSWIDKVSGWAVSTNGAICYAWSWVRGKRSLWLRVRGYEED